MKLFSVALFASVTVIKVGAFSFLGNQSKASIMVRTDEQDPYYEICQLDNLKDTDKLASFKSTEADDSSPADLDLAEK